MRWSLVKTQDKVICSWLICNFWSFCAFIGQSRWKLLARALFAFFPAQLRLSPCLSVNIVIDQFQLLREKSEPARESEIDLEDPVHWWSPFSVREIKMSSIPEAKRLRSSSPNASSGSVDTGYSGSPLQIAVSFLRHFWNTSKFYSNLIFF